MKTVNVPDELVELLGEEQIEKTLIEAVVLELFREHRISAGKAAEILGLTYHEFSDLLRARNVPVVTTPPQSLETLNRLLGTEEARE